MSRVLIVDDNADLATTLRDVLASANADEPFDVEIAATGKSALARAKEIGFDVALVDVKLPDASGVDLIRPLREASPNGEVVLITGFASMEAAIAALRAGAFAMILKSFRPDELVTTVRQAMTKARMQRERDELERRYRAVVDLTDVIVIALDAQDNVVLFNKKAAELAGVSPEAAVSRNFMRAWIPEGDRGRLEEALALARAGKRAHSDVETGFVATGHDYARRVRWHLGGMVDLDEGALVYGIGIDVTERRALEKRAADAEALSAMGTLALNLAHEIRNPLNAAKLQLHLLGKKIDKQVGEEAARAAMHRRVEIVGDEIARLNRLLTEFLELARPRGIAREPVHVGELVDSVLSLERESAEARGVRVVRDVAHGAVAIGDAEKLRQVVLNLVVNALEAMKDGGVLTVRAAAAKEGDGDRIVLSVEDTGPGIPAEVRAQVFDPFFTTKEAGTGLGLSIVRKIVDQHAGDVRLESEVGKGTTVRVWIPSGR
ncbi:MAG TPA: ATP-binding protein [Polyangiaceae bacterium]|jgi:PAS domain S-box-containing protein